MDQVKTEQAFDQEAAKYPLPQMTKLKATLTAWEWLEDQFGIDRVFVYDMARLGFVLAGGAAGCMLDISQGREPCTIPGDVDFFYKGITETFGKAVRNLGDHPHEGYRSEALGRLLGREGFEIYYTNEAAITYHKMFSPKNKVGLKPGADSVLWGNPNKLPSPEPVTPTAPRLVNLQVIVGAEKGFARWGTFAALLKSSDLGSTVAAHLRETGNDFDTEARLLRLERLQNSVAVGPLPVWHRFDFTVTCMELDGENLLFLPFSDEDRRKKRLRLMATNRSPMKMISRLAKYQAKGFNLDAFEVLKFGKMLEGLPEKERAEVDKFIGILSDSNLDPDLAREAINVSGNPYDRDTAEVEMLRDQYWNAVRKSSALEYRISELTRIVRDSLASNKGSAIKIEYFM